MAVVGKSGRLLTLMTFEASSGHRRAAITVSAILVAVAAFTLVFARTPGPVIAPFLPAFLAAIALIDGITAYMLFRQFASSRMPALAVLSSAYLFTALIVVPHILTFPGVFSETGLLGAGPQTAVWLWAMWHAGFPLLTLAYWYVARRSGVRSLPEGSERGLALGVIVGIPALVAALTYITTSGHAKLPIIIAKGNYALLTTSGVGPFALLCGCLALAAIVTHFRGRTAANLWLSVALLATVLDVAITLAGGARYSLGWYVARLDSLLAASAVLGALLHETGHMTGVVALAESRLRAVVDGVADALITLDPEGCVRSINPAAKMLFGYDASELIGKSITDFIPNFYETQRAQAGQSAIEAIASHRNGRVFPIEITTSTTREGESPGTIVIARGAQHDRRLAARSHRDRAGAARIGFVASGSRDHLNEHAEDPARRRHRNPHARAEEGARKTARCGTAVRRRVSRDALQDDARGTSQNDDHGQNFFGRDDLRGDARPTARRCDGEDGLVRHR